MEFCPEECLYRFLLIHYLYHDANICPDPRTRKGVESWGAVLDRLGPGCTLRYVDIYIEKEMGSHRSRLRVGHAVKNQAKQQRRLYGHSLLS